MMTAVAALFYAFVSLMTARLMIFEKVLEQPVFRVLVSWALMAPFSFFLPPGPLPMITCGIVLLLMAPQQAVHRVIYFIGMLPAVPEYIAFDVPFPGLNYLINLNYWKLTILITLLPLYMQYGKRKQKRPWSGVDYAVFWFFIYTAVMSLRELPFTSMLREFVDQFILLFLPYFVLTRYLDTADAFRECVRNILYFAIILSAVGIFSTLTKWDFYRMYDYTQLYEFRNGLLRISLTIHTASLATMMSLGLAVVEYLRIAHLKGFSHSAPMGTFRVWFLRFLFFFIAFATGNRGGLLQFLMVPMIFYGMLWLSKEVRRIIIVVGVLLVFLGIGALQTLDWSQFDEHGTFEYRYNIILAAIVQFFEHPIFGKMYYLEDGNFDHMVQGLGIIDIVNWYVQVVLEFGLVGLILFLMMYLGSTMSLYKSVENVDPDDSLRYLSVLMLAVFIPYMIVIGTTSNVSVLPLQGTLF
ncbi:O-antigen ligase family protein, partial [bacterium]|nr:O-antigen ligase family protein [bacterium]